MNFWEFLITAVSSGTIAVFIREVAGAYLNVIKGRSDIANKMTVTERENERQDRQDEESRTNAYIEQLRKDYKELKAELVTLKENCDERDEKNGARITELEKHSSNAEKNLVRAEARIEIYEEKLREMKVKFKPWTVEGTKDSPPLKDNNNATS